jgi:hypothetical protein
MVWGQSQMECGWWVGLPEVPWGFSQLTLLNAFIIVCTQVANAGN